MFDQLLENTILLFVAVDPIALVPIFASLTQGLNKNDIKKIYIQATIVSFFVLSLFYVFGTAILDIMGISMSSFKIIGGLFLIAIAFQMVLEQRQSRRQNTAEVALDDESIQSLAIFPLAIHLIAGPGAMTTDLLIAETNAINTTETLINFIPILIIIVLVAFEMWLSASISKTVSQTSIIVKQKIMGIWIGAIAI